MDDPGLMTDEQFASWLASREISMSVGFDEAQISAMSDDVLDREVVIICERKLRNGSASDFAAVPAGVRAFHATRLFEWAVGAEGISEFLLTHPEPHILEAVFDGYRHLGLAEHAAQLERALLPLAVDRAERRAEPGDSFENSFEGGAPDEQVNDLVVLHDDVRIAYARGNATEFTG